MDRKIMTKVLAAFLAFILTFANVALLGISANKAYGAEKDLEGQAKNVDKAEIEFDAYFEEEGEISHSKLLDVSEEEKLSLNIKVKEGYLTNASVKIKNSNFKVQETDDNLNIIQSISGEENKIILNQINKEESVVLNIPIKINADSNFDVNNLDKIASVELEGTYVNSKGKEVEINKEIEIRTTIDGKAEAKVTAEVLKYVSYNVNENEGLILQTSIKSKLEGNILPVKATKLEIEIPNINNVEPKTITLFAKSLKATSGEEGKILVKDIDYTYKDGKITLALKNNDEILSWMKNVEDEIILTCVYEHNAITPKANMKINVKSDIIYYGKELRTVTSQINETKELTNQIGEIVTGEIKLSETTLYKGYMEETKGNNTEFASELSLNIGYSELVDKITFKEDTKYVDESGNTFTSNPLYTYSKISKENLSEILGEDGYIKIYNKDGELIATLDKDNLEYKYEEISGVTFETSKPVAEGILKLENGKAIKPLEYSKEQIENFIQIRTDLNMNVIKDDSVIINGTKSGNINLLKSETKAELSLSKTDLSTVMTNKNVELRVTLKTTGPDTVLYKNPEIEIILPKYITKIEAENVKLLYEKDLKFKDVKIDKNENGNLVIKISLVGEQTEYNNLAIAEGATILMNADITLNELTPTRKDKIVLNVKNAKTSETVTSETVTSETDIKFVAPYGIATVNQITGFNEKGETATSISGNKGVGEIKTRAEARKAKVNMIAINNYEEGCENIKILGRTPFEGNKTIKSGNDLGSTFTAKMVNRIKAIGGVPEENITVYYSKNGNASKDLSNSGNGWETEPSNLEEVKSFMIVLNNFTLKTGEVLGFSYEIEVPEGLEHNEETYGTFAVYYTKQNKEEGIAKVDIAYEESAEAGSIGLTTGVGPNLAINLTANVEANSEVEERSNIKYTVKVKNNAELTAKNVNVKVKVPERAFVINEGNIDVNSKEINLNLAEIAKGAEGEVTFTLRVPGYMKETLSGSTNDNIHYYDENGNEISKDEIDADFNTTLKRENFETDEEYEQYKKDLEKYLADKEEQEIKIESKNKIDVKVDVTVEGYEDIFESNTFTNKIVSATTNPRIGMKLSSTPLGTLDVGVNAQIFIDITKNIQEDMTNVVITGKLPEGLTYVSSEGESTYDENTRTITWKYDKLQSNTRTVLQVKVEDLPDGIYSKDFEIKLNATCNETDKTFTSEELILKTAKQGFSITQTSNISDGYLSAGEEITYVVTVKNLSSIGAKLTITDKIPAELEFIKYLYTQNGKTVEARTNPVIPIDLEAGETLNIYITAKAKMMGQNTKITNKVELSSQLIEKLEAEDLTHTLLGVNGEDPDVPENPDKPQVEKYRISGTAWVDANRNGKRDDGEELLPNIKVYLLNAINNNVISETTTNANGNYTFLNIDKGNYIVAFEYDLNKYELAEYQKSGVEEDKNSDVIKMTLKVNGKENTYAASNMITLNSNMYNLDLGLTNSTKFDLSLQKTVNLVQVSKNGKTKSYNFKDVELAKVELPEKEIPGSIVAITYSIKVTNEGAVPGYANKIVDYKAKDLDFSSTLNPEWYQDVSGNLYNTTLSSRLIKPGETVEVQLILTKTMTSENTGLSNNTAEIAESSNDQGYADVDSVPGNKNEKEDDIGSADVIITVKTGGIIFYGGIILIVLGIFALGAYEINKRVLRKI